MKTSCIRANNSNFTQIAFPFEKPGKSEFTTTESKGVHACKHKLKFQEWKTQVHLVLAYWQQQQGLQHGVRVAKNTGSSLSCVIMWIKWLFLEKDCSMKQPFSLGWKSFRNSIRSVLPQWSSTAGSEIWTGALGYDNNINNQWQLHILDIDMWHLIHSSPKSMERSPLPWAIDGNQR